MGGLFDKGGLEEARIAINQVEERYQGGGLHTPQSGPPTIF